MNTNHTKGNWETLPYPIDCGKEYIGMYWIKGPPDEDGFTSIAKVNPRGRLPNDGEETKANAQLIAAAPEMLAALQALVDCPDYRNISTQEMNQAKVLLAKLTK